MITVGMLAKIRRMYFRDKLSIREITRLTNLSRNTIRQWLRQADMSEPQYAARPTRTIVEPYFEQIRQWLKTDSHRAKRDRRTARAMFNELKSQGYTGSYLTLVPSHQYVEIRSPRVVAWQAQQFSSRCGYS